MFSSTRQNGLRRIFPVIQKYISAHAVDASTLVVKLKADPTASKIGITPASAVGPELPVKFTGVVGKDIGGGVYEVAVPGVPASQAIRIVTGPVILSTDLRDVTGNYTQNTPGINNQTDFQNAASALNTVMKTQVLAKVDTAKLTGKKVMIEGAFTLLNPALWTVTPSELTVK